MTLPTASISKTCWTKDVYEPSDDTFLLTDALETLAKGWEEKPPHTIVELGCGSGFVTCSAALLLKHLKLGSAQVVAIDHNLAAVHAAQQTFANHEVAGCVELVQADMFSCWNVNFKGHVDLLMFNPPYVPTPDEEWESSGTGVVSSWAGGDRGRRVIDRFLPMVPELLAPGGQLLLVTVSENRPSEIIAELEKMGLTGEIMLGRQADEESLQIVRVCKPTA